MAQDKLNEIRKKCERCVEFCSEYETVLELIDEVEKFKKREAAYIKAICDDCYFCDSKTSKERCKLPCQCINNGSWQFDFERFGGDD
jgi:hypothetical protein